MVTLKEIAVFEAQCANCASHFSHPSLGDFAYGEVFLCTLDGNHYATVSAFTDFSQRVKALMGPGAENSLWSILASLADPISGQPLSSGIRCPHCASDNLAYWAGRRVGVSKVPEATFTHAAALSQEELARRVAAAKSESNET
jgi:hypothetical protein